MQDNDLDFLKQAETQLTQLNKEFNEVNEQIGTLSEKIFEIQCALNKVAIELRTRRTTSQSTMDQSAEAPLAESASKLESRECVVDETFVEAVDSNGKPIEVRYSSMLVERGFDRIDTSDTIGARSIYVIEVMSENTARFYPIVDSATRMINNRQDLLDPVCDADEDIEPNDFRITPENYGTLRLDGSTHWVVVKPCRIVAK